MGTPLPIRPQQVVRVATPEELQAARTRFMVQGFSVVTESPTSVLLIKRKEFNIMWAVIGFFFCVLPLLIYLVYYSTQSDQVVQIELVAPSTASQPIPPPPGSPPTLSTTNEAPLQVISPDGKYYWDGQAWRPIEE